MAAKGELEKKQWELVTLQYGDGVKMTVRLDAPTVARLEKGDKQREKSCKNDLTENKDDSKQVGASHASVMIENPGDTSLESQGLDEESQQSSSDKTYNFWSREATLLLISLYKEHENDFEDPGKVKKDVWLKICEKMKQKNFNFTQNKIECKWRSLVQSHKDILHNRQETGQKRKCFQFYKEMEEILSKRHDINPPVTAGTGLKTSESNKKMKFSTKVSPSTSSSSSSSLEDDKEEKIGKRPPKKSYKHDSSDNEVIEYLKEMEKRQKEAWLEREKRKDERANERNNLLREFLKVFKND